MAIETIDLACSHCGAPLLDCYDGIWSCDYCGSVTLIKGIGGSIQTCETGSYFSHGFLEFKVVSTVVLEVSITKCDPSISGNVTLPSFVKLNGKTFKVVEISSSAFAGCNDITALNLPSEIKRIGNSAFSRMRIPEGFKIPDTVQSIGDFAFNESTNLRTIEVPSSVKSIGYATFSSCRDLESVYLSEGLESIGPMAFRRSGRLSIVTTTDRKESCVRGRAYLPTSLRDVGKYVFDFSGISSVDVGHDTIYDQRQSIIFSVSSREIKDDVNRGSPLISTEGVRVKPKKKGLFQRLGFKRI